MNVNSFVELAELLGVDQALTGSPCGALNLRHEIGAVAFQAPGEFEFEQDRPHLPRRRLDARTISSTEYRRWAKSSITRAATASREGGATPPAARRVSKGASSRDRAPCLDLPAADGASSASMLDGAAERGAIESARSSSSQNGIVAPNGLRQIRLGEAGPSSGASFWRASASSTSALVQGRAIAQKIVGAFRRGDQRRAGAAKISRP